MSKYIDEMRQQEKSNPRPNKVSYDLETLQSALSNKDLALIQQFPFDFLKLNVVLVVPHMELFECNDILEIIARYL